MKVVSLFAGCGGLDLGFEQAGFDVIWANEFDSSIHETYRLNHPHTVLNTSDIRTIRGTDVPNCEYYRWTSLSSVERRWQAKGIR